jgi:dinuclear metal center YbgI/SA1388 family protein
VTQLKQIVEYCNELLSINDFRDYCPNGLQVEGRADVKKIALGVTASQAFLEQAVEQGADAVLVHHGYFWKGEDASIVGLKKNRIACLLNNQLSLLAYHLPLDAHKDFGNNIELARKLGIEAPSCEEQGSMKGLLWQGKLSQAMSAEQFSQLLQQKLNRPPLHLSSTRQQPIQAVAWCTGGAQGYIEQAAARGVDAYISGEVSEQTFHLARELDIHYFAAGHHATESFGVQALGAHLVNKFDIDVEFIDIANPV